MINRIIAEIAKSCITPTSLLCERTSFWPRNTMTCPNERAKALLDSEFPLSDILKDFEKIEGDHMDIIRSCIENHTVLASNIGNRKLRGEQSRKRVEIFWRSRKIRPGLDCVVK